jgi:mRNA interferase MazF
MFCSRDDVVLLPIPFTDLSSSKVRPAIVVGHGSWPGDLLVAPVTSQLGNADLIISQWAEAGLNVPSGIKGQICTVEVRLVRKVVGQITPQDRAALDALLRKWLEL